MMIEVASLSIERWYRLEPQEQRRFRRLARLARRDSERDLTREERKELKAIWRKLEARELLREVAGLTAPRRGRAPESNSDARIH